MSLCYYLSDCDDMRVEESRLMGNDVEAAKAAEMYIVGVR